MSRNHGCNQFVYQAKHQLGHQKCKKSLHIQMLIAVQWQMQRDCHVYNNVTQTRDNSPLQSRYYELRNIGD